MNLKKISRIAMVSMGSAAMVLGLASCSLDYVVGYVYMTTSKTNVIDQYSIDFQSGSLSQVGTPVSTGNNPVKIVSSPSGSFVYVLNQGDSTVQEFAVQSGGALVSKNTYPTGKNPTALTFDPQGKFLYVTFSYQNGTSGSGAVSIFPVNADNSLGTATVQPVGNNPVAVVASNFNHYVYVLDQEPTLTPSVLGFSQNTSTGALTALPGTTLTTVAGNTVATGYAAGVVPSAMAEELTARFLYVTDQASNQLIGYVVQSNGTLLPMVANNGPFRTGLFPIAVTVDPTGTLLYVVNYNADTVQGYAIDSITGTPSPAVGAFATPVGAGPTCVAIDPSLGTFLYTSNNLDNTVTGLKLDPHTGGLSGVQNSPFTANGQPTCLTVVPAGSHASQTIVP